MKIELKDNKIYMTRAGEAVCVSACGKNSIRFQAAPSGKLIEQNWTLMPQEVPAKVWEEEDKAVLETGTMRAELTRDGKLTYFRDGKQILREQPEMTFNSGIRNYRNKGSHLWTARISFEANENEHFYGLGHEPTDCFDLKGCTYDLRHLNAKCSMPYVYSTLGYGFLWNQPSTGRCELACNRTRWTSDSTRQVDYVVIGGSPREVAGTLADLTGHAPMMPDWATGFWQCKLRYETQEQVLSVARRYKELGIPLSVIVIDYFHWTEQGDYRYDPKYWPDPRAMADELHKMGIRLMVSMWPTINEKSENYQTMLDNNMLIRTVSGSNRVFDFYGPQAEIDPTNPETRKYVWQRLKENYVDNGVDLLWFDEAEPEIHPEHFDNLILSLGNGDEVGLIYPYYYAQLVYDGMKEMGRDDIVTLSRCAYIGAQKFGTLVWSGDIPSTFESLRKQVKSGLNMAMCGIPWWTTDIGGFYGGDIESDEFRELIVRWFQYGVFCPVFRCTAAATAMTARATSSNPPAATTSCGASATATTRSCAISCSCASACAPYIHDQMAIASKDGVPVMRPLIFDWPEDETCTSIGDEFLFGDDILFAPIVNRGETSRRVYLPAGEWVFARDGKEYAGGQWITCTLS